MNSNDAFIEDLLDFFSVCILEKVRARYYLKIHLSIVVLPSKRSIGIYTITHNKKSRIYSV